MDAERDLGDSYYIGSHMALLQRPSGIAISPRALDAIVRTIRPESLRPAALLAGDIGCALMVLCNIEKQVRPAVHEGSEVTNATHAYWQGVLERRFQLMIDHIATLLLPRDANALVYRCALMSLPTAHKRLTAISVLTCVSFVHAWRTDLDVWRHRLVGLLVPDDLNYAVKFLEFPVLDGCVNQ